MSSNLLYADLLGADTTAPNAAPAAASVAASVSAGAEAPVETPVAASVETPVAASVAVGAAASVAAGVETPVAASVETPVAVGAAASVAAGATAPSAFPRLAMAGLASLMPDAPAQHRCHRRIAASKRGFGEVDQFCFETLYGFSRGDIDELSRETIARQSAPVIDPSIDGGFVAPNTNGSCPASCDECFGRVPVCVGCYSRVHVVDESGTEFAVEADCVVDGRAFRCRKCSPRIRPMTIWQPEIRPAARLIGSRIPVDVPEPPLPNAPVVYVLDGNPVFANLLARCASAPAPLRCDACDAEPPNRHATGSEPEPASGTEHAQASEVEPMSLYVPPRGEEPLFNISTTMTGLPNVLLDQGGVLLCRRCSGRYIAAATTRPRICPSAADGSRWLSMSAEVRWLGTMPALNPPPESIARSQSLRSRIDPARSPVGAAAAGMPFASWSWAIPDHATMAQMIDSDDDALWAAASGARGTVGGDCERAFSRDNCRMAIMQAGRGVAGRLFDHVEPERLAAGLVKCAARRSGRNPCTCPADDNTVDHFVPCMCNSGAVPTLVSTDEIVAAILDAMRVPVSQLARLGTA
jgi:hypothetical protein